MSEPTARDDARSCTCSAHVGSRYCDRCDLLLGLNGVHVIAVEVSGDGGLRVVVETPASPMGCRECGVLARARGRRDVALVDVPSAGRAVQLVWRKRTWRCLEPACPTGSFSEVEKSIARPRALLSTRAAWWAIGQLRREHACIEGLARQLGTTWKTVWRAVEPLLVLMAADPARFNDVTALGVDEHIWHHVRTKPVDHGGRGPKELTGMVDLSRDQHGRVRARLLDLVPGRSGRAYGDWLKARGEAFTSRVEVATLDPFHGYKNAIDDELEDATAVLDAFHVIKLGTRSTRSAAGSSRTPSDTAVTATTRSTGSATSSAPVRRSSPTGSGPACPPPSTPASSTKKSASPGPSPSVCAWPTGTRSRPRAARSPSGSSTPCRPAQSRSWPASAAP